MSEPKVWTLFKGNSQDALKDDEWVDMLEVVLGGPNRRVVIEVRDAKDGE